MKVCAHLAIIILIISSASAHYMMRMMMGKGKGYYSYKGMSKGKGKGYYYYKGKGKGKGKGGYGLVGSVQIGARPFWLVDEMKDSFLKKELSTYLWLIELNLWIIF